MHENAEVRYLALHHFGSRRLPVIRPRVGAYTQFRVQLCRKGGARRRGESGPRSAATLQPVAPCRRRDVPLLAMIPATERPVHRLSDTAAIVSTLTPVQGRPGR